MEQGQEQSGLQDFLDEQHSDGSEEGEGAFTLDSKKARDKLGRFQLARPALYIVKAVQAAVAAGAKEIELTVTRSALCLKFSGPAPDSLCPSLLGESLLTLHNLPDGPLRHLAVALSSAKGSSFQTARWSTPLGCLQISPDAIELLPAERSDFCFTIERSSKFISWVRGTVFVDEIKALTDHCGWGSCVVKLDGRRLEPAGWNVFSKGRCDCLGLWPSKAPSYWDPLKKNLLERHLGQVELRLHALPTTAGYSSLDASHLLVQREEHHQEHSPWLIWPYAPSEVTASIALTSDLVGVPRVAFVKDGALLGREVDWGHPGALVLMDATELSTDLTEFGVVKNHQFQDALDRLEPLVKDTAHGVARPALSTVFDAGGITGPGSTAKLDVWTHWLQEHQVPSTASTVELIEAFLPNKGISHARLSDSLEKALRIAHGRHLPFQEHILKAYSDVLLGESAIGFAVTAKRLLWKSSFFEANYLHWDDLDSIDFRLEQETLVVSEAGPSTTLNPHLARCLWGLMTTLKKRPLTMEKTDLERLRSDAMKALGKPPKVYYYPHIPLDKLSTAGAAFGQAVESDEQVVMLYDSTLFGKCDNGVLLTLKRICWCNLMSTAVSYTWAELTGNDIQRLESGLKIKERELLLNSEGVRDGLFEIMTARLV